MENLSIPYLTKNYHKKVEKTALKMEEVADKIS